MDTFFLKLLAVKGSMEARLKCMQLMLTWEQRAFVARQHAKEKSEACQAIMRSTAPCPSGASPSHAGGYLLYVLSLVLELGNFLSECNPSFTEQSTDPTARARATEHGVGGWEGGLMLTVTVG